MRWVGSRQMKLCKINALVLERELILISLLLFTGEPKEVCVQDSAYAEP